MDKKIKKNYLLNSINQVLVLIIPLITTPYLSRVLEPDGIGIYSYKSSITAYFVLFATFGISCYGQRAISYCQDDVYRRSVTFWETTIIKALSSSISLLFFLIMASQSASSTLYYIMSLNIISCLFDISWFYQGIEDLKSITIRNLFFKRLNVICILIFVICHIRNTEMKIASNNNSTILIIPPAFFDILFIFLSNTSYFLSLEHLLLICQLAVL